MKIFKYHVPLDVSFIEMPTHSKILTVQMRGSEPYLWAITYDRQSPCRREVAWIPTGKELPIGHSVYVGTVQVEFHAVLFVFHLFDLGEQLLDSDPQT